MLPSAKDRDRGLPCAFEVREKRRIDRASSCSPSEDRLRIPSEANASNALFVQTGRGITLSPGVDSTSYIAAG